MVLKSNDAELKYNYVVFGSDADYMCTAYADIENCSWAKYIENLDCKNSILNKIYKYHTSPRLNQMVTIPFRKVWNRFSFVNTFEDNKPICFVFFGCDTRRIESGLILYLRKKYPNCKIISFCQDLVRTYGSKFKEFYSLFDAIYSFDQNDVKTYDLIYQPDVYSKINVEEDLNLSNSDVYFLGKAKDRLDQIITVYEKLTDNGLRCEFYITGVEKEKQIYSDQIHYCDGMNYLDNIKHIMKTNCILEIMQGGGHGYTLRYAEAIMYNKKLLTNNPEISKADCFNKDYISVFDDVESIDINFIKGRRININEEIKESLSPLKFFKRVDCMLDEK